MAFKSYFIDSYHFSRLSITWNKRDPEFDPNLNDNTLQNIELVTHCAKLRGQAPKKKYLALFLEHTETKEAPPDLESICIVSSSCYHGQELETQAGIFLIST